MALIKCRGYVVVAQSLLPVGRTTIVYGSNDAGRTIHASDKEFDRLMHLVCDLHCVVFRAFVLGSVVMLRFA